MEAAESLFDCLEQVADPRKVAEESDIPFRPYCG